MFWVAEPIKKELGRGDLKPSKEPQKKLDPQESPAMIIIGQSSTILRWTSMEKYYRL